jgi:hypothetical protein
MEKPALKGVTPERPLQPTEPAEPTVAERLAAIAREWELSPEKLAELLHLPPGLSPDQALAAGEREKGTVPPGLESAPALIAIHVKLSRLLGEPEAQLKWLVQANSVYDGNSPLELMRASPRHLAWVAYTLDTATAQPASRASER